MLDKHLLKGDILAALGDAHAALGERKDAMASYERALLAVRGDENTVRATSGSRNAAIDDVVAAMPAHHPAAPSPTATAITESIRSTGPVPGPP